MRTDPIGEGGRRSFSRPGKEGGWLEEQISCHMMPDNPALPGQTRKPEPRRFFGACCSLAGHHFTQPVPSHAGRSGMSSAKIKCLSTMPWNHAALSSSSKAIHILELLFSWAKRRVSNRFALLLAALTTEVWACICCWDKSEEMAGWPGEHLSRALTVHLIYKQGEGLIFPSLCKYTYASPGELV